MSEIDHLPMLGLDWRDAMKELQCTRPELERWVSEGRLPYDGRVQTYRFSSMSRSYTTVEGGWRPETIEAAKPHVEEWRAEYKEMRKEARKRARADKKRNEEQAA
jgi:hypothetical protein